MKVSLTVASLLAGLVIAPAMSHAATITLNLSGGVLFKSNGTTPLPLNSTIVVLADADGDGFGDITQATASWKPDADDFIVSRFGTNNNGDAGIGTFAQPITGVNVPDGLLTPDDKFLVIWYDKPFNISDTGPGAGIAFGQYRTDNSALDFSNWNFTIPASGTKTINFLTVANGGSLAESAGRANLVTGAVAVPEPASLSLLATAASLLVVRRRRTQR